MKNNFMVTIGVSDLDRSVKFYTKYLNFSLIRRITPSSEVEIAFLLFNEQIEIELIRRTDAPPVKNSEASITLSFRTDDINREYESLKTKNLPSLSPPYSIPSGVQFIRFSDPDGTPIAFIQE